MLQYELDTAVSLAEIASRSILYFYNKGFEVEQKLGVDNLYEPVTIADREASRIIVSGLADAFPEDAILSEEEPDDLNRRISSERVWMIDPIDGTAGFVKGDGDFGVQIGLTIAGKPTLGVVLLPFHRSMIYAVKGSGAFRSTEGATPVKLNASEHIRLQQMTAAFSRNHPSKRIARIIEFFSFQRIVNRGSVGLKVGLIADQTCDIYIHPSPRTKLWDTCAPQIILEEAGGKITDLFGFDLSYDKPELQNLNGILATNGNSHEVAVEKMRPLLDEFGRVRVP